MKPYIQRLSGKMLLPIYYLLLTLQYAIAQAPATVYLVSTATNNTICQGETITFIAVPPTSPAGITYTYKFYRGNNTANIVVTNSTTDIVNGNRYTTTRTLSNFNVKVEIIANPGGANPTEESTEMPVIVKTVTTPKIMEQTTTGVRELSPQVLSSQPDIVLTARDMSGNTLPGDGVFSGDGVKKAGISYIFSPAFVNSGQVIISYDYLHTNGCRKIALDTITVNANTGSIRGLEQGYCLNAGAKPIALNLEDINNRPEECYYIGTAFHYCQKLNTDYTLIDIRGNGVSGSVATSFTFDPQLASQNGDDTTDVIIEYTSSNFYTYYFLSDPTNIREHSRSIQTVIDTQRVALFKLDELTVTNSGQEIKPSYCRSENITLTGSPSSTSGKFLIIKPDKSTENNVSTPFAIPLNDKTRFPAGNYKIIYSYANANNCLSRSDTIRFELLEVPSIPFLASIPDVTQKITFNYCVGDSILPLQFTAEPGLKTLWRKDDIQATPTDTSLFNPQVNNTFSNSVTIYVTQANEACESIARIITINVRPKPVASFIYKNVCTNGPTEFKETTDFNGNTVLSKIWDFGDGDFLPEGSGNIPAGTHNNRTTGSYTNPIHAYANPGTYHVKLILVTSACPDTIIKPVYIFPLQSKFPYLENFENGSGGWLAKNDSLSSWELKQPNGTRIIPDASSPIAWITSKNNNSYNASENSFVESPCFQFNDTLQPFLSVNIISDIEEGLDGAVIQYVIDDGNTYDDLLQWKVLGTINQGIQWYNASGIVSNPGGQNSSLPPVGWSGSIHAENNESQWVTAKFNLGQVKQEAAGFPVRFRIAFSSNADNPPNRTFDGFAFDNFIIGEINRTVLLEHFTNTSQPGFIQENKKIYETIATNDIAAIQYHTSFPDTNDPFNKSNSADPSARALLYGIAESNRTVLDGINFENKPFSADEWGKNANSRRILFEAPFKIDIQLTGGGNDPLNIKTSVSKNNTLKDFNNPLVVQVAIVEKEVIIGADTFQNVLRKLLPDAAGQHLPGLWKATDTTRTEVIERTWLPTDAASAPNKFAAIVFVQDENTKEVYQAKQELITVPLPADPSGDRNGIPTGWDSIQDHTILISPNPASNNVHISFNSIPEEDFILTVFDALGKVITSSRIVKGSSTYVLHTDRYSNGLYLVQLMKAATTQVIRKKLFIAH